MHHSNDNWVPAPTPKVFDGIKEMQSKIDVVAEKLGATGQYPNGKLTGNDEGEIRFAVGSDYSRQVVFMDFGKSVRSVGMSPQQARELADSLRKHARRASGVIELDMPGTTDHVADNK